MKLGAVLVALLHAALAAGFVAVPLAPARHRSTRLVAAASKGREPDRWQQGDDGSKSGARGRASPRLQGQPQQHPEGSWRCPSCGNVNWPQRALCNRCGGPKDGAEGLGQPDGAASTAALVADVMAAARRGNGKKAAELLAALPSAMADGSRRTTPVRKAVCGCSHCASPHAACA